MEDKEMIMIEDSNGNKTEVELVTYLIDDTKQKIVEGYLFDGWYYDIECTDEFNEYEDKFTGLGQVIYFVKVRIK